MKPISSLFQKQSDIFIIRGDFNAKNISWDSLLTATNGRLLYEGMREPIN